MSGTSFSIGIKFNPKRIYFGVIWEISHEFSTKSFLYTDILDIQICIIPCFPINIIGTTTFDLFSDKI